MERKIIKYSFEDVMNHVFKMVPEEKSQFFRGYECFVDSYFITLITYSMCPGEYNSFQGLVNLTLNVVLDEHVTILQPENIKDRAQYYEGVDLGIKNSLEAIDLAYSEEGAA